MLALIAASNGTRLISVSAENQNPALAQKISQTIVSEYIHSIFDQRLGILSEANKFLNDEVGRLSSNMRVHGVAVCYVEVLM